MTRPVYVAGRGAISGFGRGVAALVDGVFAGETCLNPRRRTASFEAPTEFVAEAPDGLLGSDDEESEFPRRGAIIAADEALAEAGSPDRSELSLVLATTKADMSGICGEGSGLASPMHLARQLTADLGFGRAPSALSCACASGVLAIAAAARRIASGEHDRVLAIATDTVNEFILRGFGGMGALDPGHCRPFDRERRGVSLGDGAAAMLLTSDPTESIGVRVRGYAGANDACHVTGPDYEGLGIGLAAQRAIAHAGLSLDDIDLLHLHATGTRANDKSEAIGLSNVWARNHRPTPPAFGSKSQTGHTLGAAGIVESLLAIAALDRRTVPGNRGLVDSDCDPRMTLPTSPLPLIRARHALKVASGFGGIQGAAVFSV